MNEIERTQQRTRSYWYCDGIAELVGGIALALVGIPMLAAARTGIEMLSTIALMAMIILFPASARVVRYLKDRITHTRTGYVKYPAPTMSKGRKLLLLALFLCIALLVLLTQWGGVFSLDGVLGKALLIGSGSGITVAFVIRAIKLSMPRTIVGAVATATAIIVSMVEGMGFVEGMGLLLTALGTASIITGAMALISYILRHPRTPQENT